MTTPTEDDQEKSKVREESDSTIHDSSHQTVTSTPPVIPPFTEVSSSKPSLLVTPPPSTRKQQPITTSLPEITHSRAFNHKFYAVIIIRDRNSDDSSRLRFLERHTADLIEKYSVLPWPRVCHNPES
ncbi:hypothetical protein Tco_1147141 [Tanacetum coccineum]